MHNKFRNYMKIGKTVKKSHSSNLKLMLLKKNRKEYKYMILLEKIYRNLYELLKINL